MAAEEMITKVREKIISVISEDSWLVPSLTDKFLGRPPFTFLVAIISETIKITGYGAGLFTAEEMTKTKTSKAMKIRFLVKALHFVAMTSEDRPDIFVVPANVLSGKEPHATQLFLLSFCEGSLQYDPQTCGAAEKYICSADVNFLYTQGVRTRKQVLRMQAIFRGKLARRKFMVGTGVPATARRDSLWARLYEAAVSPPTAVVLAVAGATPAPPPAVVALETAPAVPTAGGDSDEPLLSPAVVGLKATSAYGGTHSENVPDAVPRAPNADPSGAASSQTVALNKGTSSHSQPMKGSPMLEPSPLMDDSAAVSSEIGMVQESRPQELSPPQSDPAETYAQPESPTHKRHDLAASTKSLDGIMVERRSTDKGKMHRHRSSDKGKKDSKNALGGLVTPKVHAACETAESKERSISEVIFTDTDSGSEQESEPPTPMARVQPKLGATTAVKVGAATGRKPKMVLEEQRRRKVSSEAPSPGSSNASSRLSSMCPSPIPPVARSHALAGAVSTRDALLRRPVGALPGGAGLAAAGPAAAAAAASPAALSSQRSDGSLGEAGGGALRLQEEARVAAELRAVAAALGQRGAGGGGPAAAAAGEQLAERLQALAEQLAPPAGAGAGTGGGARVAPGGAIVEAGAAGGGTPGAQAGQEALQVAGGSMGAEGAREAGVEEAGAGKAAKTKGRSKGKQAPKESAAEGARPPKRDKVRELEDKGTRAARSVAPRPPAAHARLQKAQQGGDRPEEPHSEFKAPAPKEAGAKPPAEAPAPAAAKPAPLLPGAEREQAAAAAAARRERARAVAAPPPRRKKRPPGAGGEPEGRLHLEGVKIARAGPRDAGLVPPPVSPRGPGASAGAAGGGAAAAAAGAAAGAGGADLDLKLLAHLLERAARGRQPPAAVRRTRDEARLRREKAERRRRRKEKAAAAAAAAVAAAAEEEEGGDGEGGGNQAAEAEGDAGEERGGAAAARPKTVTWRDVGTPPGKSGGGGGGGALKGRAFTPGDAFGLALERMDFRELLGHPHVPPTPKDGERRASLEGAAGGGGADLQEGPAVDGGSSSDEAAGELRGKREGKEAVGLPKTKASLGRRGNNKKKQNEPSKKEEEKFRRASQLFNQKQQRQKPSKRQPQLGQPLSSHPFLKPKPKPMAARRAAAAKEEEEEEEDAGSGGEEGFYSRCLAFYQQKFEQAYTREKTASAAAAAAAAARPAAPRGDSSGGLPSIHSRGAGHPALEYEEAEDGEELVDAAAPPPPAAAAAGQAGGGANWDEAARRLERGAPRLSAFLDPPPGAGAGAGAGAPALTRGGGPAGLVALPSLGAPGPGLQLRSQSGGPRREDGGRGAKKKKKKKAKKGAELPFADRLVRRHSSVDEAVVLKSPARASKEKTSQLHLSWDEEEEEDDGDRFEANQTEDWHGEEESLQMMRAEMDRLAAESHMGSYGEGKKAIIKRSSATSTIVKDKDSKKKPSARHTKKNSTTVSAKDEPSSSWLSAFDSRFGDAMGKFESMQNF